MTVVEQKRLGRDFWLYFTGQTLSNLGSALTNFALPLIVFKLTGSALNLALTSATVFLPYLLFGLVIGAWVDRLDRKRLMIGVDILNALLIASIPVLSGLGRLSVGYIYVVGFVGSTLAIAFQAAQFAAIPTLVGDTNLVTANGRIQASFSAMGVVGPLIASALVFVMPLASVLFLDASSFVLSVVTLAALRVSFNPPAHAKDSVSPPAHIGQEVADGLRYVLHHPVLRTISLMMALVNLFLPTVGYELVYFAKRQLGVQDWQYGLLVAAGPLGIVVLALLAGPLHRRYPFSRIALTALALEGVVIILLGLTTSIWMALPLLALESGFGILFSITTGSLRQAIVPNELLGRVSTIAGVVAWSAIPAGTLLSGYLIDRTAGMQWGVHVLGLSGWGAIQNIGLVYCVVGLVTLGIPIVFALTPLGHAERYIPQPAADPAR